MAVTQQQRKPRQSTSKRPKESPGLGKPISEEEVSSESEPGTDLSGENGAKPDTQASSKPRLVSNQQRHSPLQKWGSASKARPKLRRTLYRGVNIRVITPEDWKYIWADYKMGNMAFIHTNFGMSDDVTKDNFRPYVEAALGSAGYVPGYIIHGKTYRNRKEPIGFIGIRMSGNRVMEPHIHFFGFATPRNKVEGVVRFIQEMRQMYTMIWMVPEELGNFFDHCCRYGISRRVGTIYEYTEDLKPILMYQSRST